MPRPGCPWPSSRETSSPVSAAALSPGLESALCGVAPLDPASFAAAAVALLATALVSCLVPERRAASLDPAVTLRLD